jgi:hypothetical protein
VQTDNAGPGTATGYAPGVADTAYAWFARATRRSRYLYRCSELLLVLLSAAVPLTVAVAPHRTGLTALFGSLAVVVTGLRAIFHWQDDYVRFSGTRGALEAERRLYHVGAAPYDDPATRDEELVRAVTRIEQDESGRWARLAARRVSA